MFLTVFLVVFGVLFLVKIYFVHSAKQCRNYVSLIGKTVLITGANTGIGFQSALEFAKRGAKVILACRDQGKANQAKEKIVKLTKNENISVKLMDLSSILSIKRCVEDILKTETKLDILVNNAGVGGLLNKTTEDGLQVEMQINYFGPVLLTTLLLSLLRKTPGSRIINVASLMAKAGKIDPEELNQYAGRYGTYANSKLCNILFTIRLAELLKGSGVSVFSLHPGAVRTDIFRRLSGWRKILLNCVAYFTFKTAEEGAQTIIYTATERDLDKLSGQHFEECQAVSPYSNISPDLAVEVWRETCKLLSIDEALKTALIE